VDLPPSYRAFARHFGFGITAGVWMIYVPLPPGVDRSEDLVTASQAFGSELRAGLADGQIEGEERVDDDTGLVPFACSESGLLMAWKPHETRSDDGELPVYLVDPKSGRTLRAAPNLAALIDLLVSTDFPNPLMAGSLRLPATFEPLPIK